MCGIPLDGDTFHSLGYVFVGFTWCCRERSLATTAIFSEGRSVPSHPRLLIIHRCLPPRVSRFLRAVGDPSWKIGRSITSADATAAAGENTGVGKALVGGPEGVENGSQLPAGMPAAIEVTSKGLQGGNPGASGGADGRRCGGGGEEEVSDERAIADIFHNVDLDASGHVSEEELLEGVRVTL